MLGKYQIKFCRINPSSKNTTASHFRCLHTSFVCCCMLCSQESKRHSYKMLQLYGHKLKKLLISHKSQK